MIDKHFLNLNDPYFVKKYKIPKISDPVFLYCQSIIGNLKTLKQMFSITSNGLKYLYVYFMHSCSLISQSNIKKVSVL